MSYPSNNSPTQLLNDWTNPFRSHSFVKIDKRPLPYCQFLCPIRAITLRHSYFMIGRILRSHSSVKFTNGPYPAAESLCRVFSAPPHQPIHSILAKFSAGSLCGVDQQPIYKQQRQQFSTTSVEAIFFQKKPFSS